MKTLETLHYTTQHYTTEHSRIFDSMRSPTNVVIRSDKNLTLGTSETFYSGQFTLSTQLIKPNHLLIASTDASPQFLSKLTSSPLPLVKK